MLPRKYTQAVMAGESIAGVIEITFRAITKAASKSARTGAIIFFSLSLFLVIVCLLCHCYIRTNKMVRFYTSRCQGKAVEGGRAEGEEGEVKDSGGEGEFEMESQDKQLLPSESEEEGGGELRVSAGSGELVEENGGVGVSPLTESNHDSEQRRKTFLPEKKLRDHFKPFTRVVSQIWPLIGAIFTAYFVTLLLFPGLLSEVQDCHLGSWAPIFIIAIFSITDFIAKWLALLPIEWSPRQLLIASLCRLILIPLVLLCVAPSPTHPVLRSSSLAWAAIFTFFLGASNGYLGSLPLIVVSGHVKEKKDRELAGMVMCGVGGGGEL